MLTLDRLDHLPEALIDIAPAAITDVFPNPTLIHVKGALEPPLFLSTLLHGNETTSFEVLKTLAKRWSAAAPRRSVFIFVGNVRATAARKRHLPDQPDFNRIWGPGETPHHRLTAGVLEIARSAGLFASIDIHNNTGRNPLYGCVNALRSEDLYLAGAFAPIAVYYQNPPTTQSIAFSHFCPAITLECGQPGDKAGYAAAMALIDHVMALDAFAATTAPTRLYETVGRVVIQGDAPIAFGDDEENANGCGIAFRADLEALNFKSVARGAAWARVGRGAGLRVLDEHGRDISDQFFTQARGAITLKQDVVPAMITRDEAIIREDCLCYFMRPMRTPEMSSSVE
ncbi:MAG: M14 family metallopeptidase [Pseudomonadota bacterium]